MYTHHMTWSFRALALSVAIVWALVPPLACFMPDPALTPAEMDCCKQIANDCGSSMSHDCCRTTGHTEIGIMVQVARVNAPNLADAVVPGVQSLPLRTASRNLLVQDTHAPPHDPEVSPLVIGI